MAFSAQLLQQIAPQSVTDYANDAIATRQKQQAGALNLQSGEQEVAARRRMMALSVLNGVSTQQDPTKQAMLYTKLKPMAQQIDPSLDLPDQFDPELHKALIGGEKPVTPKAPSGYAFKDDGTLAAIPGGPGDINNKPINEYQGKSGVFAARMNDSEKQIQQFQNAGLDPTEKLKAKVPLAGNYLVSDNYQQLDQAKRNFVNAVLRQESGAAINQSEFDNAEKQYFPQPGDSDETLAQKAQNRQTAIRQMEKSAGRAYTPVESPQSPQQKSSAVPKPGTIMDGYVFMGGDPADQKSWKPAR